MFGRNKNKKAKAAAVKKSPKGETAKVETKVEAPEEEMDDGVYDNFAEKSQRNSVATISSSDFGLDLDETAKPKAQVVADDDNSPHAERSFSTLARRHATDLHPRNLLDPSAKALHGWQSPEQRGSFDASTGMVMNDDVEGARDYLEKNGEGMQRTKSQKPSRTGASVKNPDSFQRQGPSKSFKTKSTPPEPPKKIEKPAKKDLPDHNQKETPATFYIMYLDPQDADAAKKLAHAIELNVQSATDEDVSVFFDLVTMKTLRLGNGKWRKTAIIERLNEIRSAKNYVIIFSEASYDMMVTADQENVMLLLEMEIALNSPRVVIPAFIGCNNVAFRGINLSKIPDAPAFNQYCQKTPKDTVTELLRRPCLKAPERFSNDELRETVFTLEDVLKGEIFEAESGDKCFLTEKEYTPEFAIVVEKMPAVVKQPEPEASNATVSPTSVDEDFDGDPEQINWGHWQLERQQVEILAKIGEGEFGEVSEGILHGTGENEGLVAKVAIKQLKPGSKPTSKAEFLREAHFMVQLHHRNLVNIYGVITLEEPVLIVSELCTHGALKSYLMKNKYLQGEVSLVTCHEMMVDIVRGMEFVAGENFVHRDLAARNVLVEKQTDSIRCKVADLGLAVRCIEDFHQGDVSQPVPIRWSSPEAIRRGHFSEFSDVWSFGIVMYEIVTFGADPYDGVSNREVVQMVCDEGVRLPCPSTKSALRGCPQSWHDIMVECWQQYPENRPSFEKLVEMVEGL